MKQCTVLIISDDAAFSNVITGRWQAERNHRPEFTLMASDLCRELDPSTFDLAIAGALKSGAIVQLEKSLSAAKKPCLLTISPNNPLQYQAALWTRILSVRNVKDAEWLDCLISLSSEMLLHAQALAAGRRLEQRVAFLERQASLGNYVLDVRHNLNNALTSILGNSELLLLDNDEFSAGVRAQVETIRNMSIRIHEILQRFSSLEKELTVGEEQARPKNRLKNHAAAGL